MEKRYPDDRSTYSTYTQRGTYQSRSSGNYRNDGYYSDDPYTGSYRASGSSRASGAQSGRSRTASARSTQNGYSTRRPASYDDGYSARRSASYDDGYSKRRSASYDDGYSARRSASYDDGYSKRRSASYDDGYSARRSASYDDGYSARRSASYDDGYSARRSSTRSGAKSAQTARHAAAKPAPRKAPAKTQRSAKPREDYLPEDVRLRRAQLRKQRIIAGVIAFIILAGIIALIIALSSGGNDDRATPNVSANNTEPASTVNIIVPEASPSADPIAQSIANSINAHQSGAAQNLIAQTMVSTNPVPTATAEPYNNPVNVDMTGVLGSASSVNHNTGSTQGLRSVTFRVAGDIMVTEEQLDWAKTITSEYDFYENFELIADSLENADYTMANMETTLGKYKTKGYSGYPCFNSPPEILLPLKDAGVDYLNLANNHMLDRYFDGMKNTVKCVELVEMDHSGAYTTREARNTPNIFEIGGIKVGFVNYTHTTNGQERVCDPEGVEFGVPYLYKSDIEGDIQAARNAGAEVVIAWPHWGDEYTHTPDDNQVKYAKRIAEAGADIILGNHSHNIQPMGFQDVNVNGRAKEVFTIFSIGNFLTSHTTKDSYYSIILEFTINEQPDGSFTVDDIGYVPTYCWIENNKVTIVPSGKYLNSKPSGMSDSEWKRMKDTYYATVEMYGTDEFKVLAS